MKKLIALLLALAMTLALSACGGNYTAVPELKLSWDMSPEEAQKANSFKTVYSTRQDGYSFVSSEPGQKLPRIAGAPLSQYMCVFENDKMIQVILLTDSFKTENGSIVKYDYRKVVDLFTKEYGPPARGLSEGGLQSSSARTVWLLESRAIEVYGNMDSVLKIVVYANAAEEDAAPAETVEAEEQPAASIPENESPEERFARILREDLKGTWISTNNCSDELTFYEDGKISVNGESYLLADMEEYETGKRYFFDIDGNYVLIGWEAEENAIYTSDLPGLENEDFVYFYREGAQNPCEPFYGSWKLKSGTGLTWDGTVVREITIRPEGELLLDGRDIGLSVSLYPDDPNFTGYRWVINHYGEDGAYFGIFFETKDPVHNQENSFLIIDNLGRSVYQRS